MESENSSKKSKEGYGNYFLSGSFIIDLKINWEKLILRRIIFTVRMGNLLSPKDMMICIDE